MKVRLQQPPPGQLRVTLKRPREPKPAASSDAIALLKDEERDAHLLDHGKLLDQEQQRAMMAHLDEETPRALSRKKFMGRPVPRLSGAYADEEGAKYRYSGRTEVARAWTPELRAIKELVERATGAKYNFLLVNRYESLQDSVQWHADDEEAIVKNTSIASVSIGATRVFRYRLAERDPVTNKQGPIMSVKLTSGSLVEMRGTMQQHYLHEIPKKKGDDGVRYNLTFRLLDFTLSEQRAPKRKKKNK